jgi:hypothetical protein
MKSLIFFLLLFLTLPSTAQTEADIRKHYAEVNKKITESVEQGFEGPLYQNQLVINKNGRSWPAVGYYADTINFWYDAPPDHLPADERNPKTTLLKVLTSRRIATGAKASEEYLFKNGNPVFFYSFWAEEGNTWEQRVYFNAKGIAFKTSVKVNELELTVKDFLNPDNKDLKPVPAKILTEAKKLQHVFLSSM